jgi:bla regulator protein BlaR1
MESIIFKTLLHSLWQGVLLAALTALIVLFTTRSSAKVRYNLFVGCLVLFVLGVGTTFLIEKNQYGSTTAIKSLSAVKPPQITPTNGITVPETPSVDFNLIAFLTRYSSAAVLIWFLIICAKSIRFMVDIRTLLQVRTSKVYHPGKALTEKVNLLAVQYGIRERVQILQSGIIRVPMVLGHFKPLILVPLGLLNGLSVEEVDAILRHEMAHIKRRDYLVNLLQSTVEILFFFNPAVLWISGLIRTERENCCDDLAVSDQVTKISYIKALVSCQEFATASPNYAMAINGGKGQLIHRVQRLISSRNQSLNKVEKVIIGLVLISSVVVTTAFSANENKQSAAPKGNLKQEKVSSVQTINSDVVNTNQIIVDEYSAEKQQRDISTAIFNQMMGDGLIKVNGDLVCKLDRSSFEINGVQQPDAVHKKYARIFLEPGDTVTYRWSKDELEEMKGAATQSRVQAMASAADADALVIEAKTKAIARAGDVEAITIEVKTNPLSKADKQKAQDTKDHQQDVQAQANNAEAQDKNARAQAANAKVQQSNALVQAENAQSADGKKTKQGKDMTTDLKADGLIRDKKNFSYQLNIDELVVDGVKQPVAVHRKYMRKYLKNANQRISTTVTTN